MTNLNPLYTTIANDKEFSLACVAIKSKGKALDAAIQVAGMYALVQAENGNVNQLNELALAMPKGSRLAALGAWATTYGAVNANDDPTTKKLKPFRFSAKKQETCDIVKAAAKMWYDCKPDSVEAGDVDFDKLFAALLQKCTAAQEKGTLKGDAAKIAAVKAVMAGTLTVDPLTV